MYDLIKVIFNVFVDHQDIEIVVNGCDLPPCDEEANEQPLLDETTNSTSDVVDIVDISKPQSDLLDLDISLPAVTVPDSSLSPLTVINSSETLQNTRSSLGDAETFVISLHYK